MRCPFLLLAALCLSGCAWLSNPDTTAALNATTAAALSYSQGNTLSAATSGIQGAAYLMRSLQSTPEAGNQQAVQTAVTQAGAAPIASTVASAVAVLVKQGKTPDAANEGVALALDAATAK